MTLPASAFPLSVSGARLIGADSFQYSLGLGVNWGGAQQDEMLPYGLDRLPRAEIIARITGWGMSHVRFPFALGTIVNPDGSLKTGLAKASRLAANPDLAGLTPWGVYQVLAEDMTAAGLYVILNQHLLYQGWCCSNTDNNGFWYNDNWPPGTFIKAWMMAAERFAGNPLTGYDIHNEPRSATISGKTVTPTWGDGDGWTDFRHMYSDMTTRIRAADPDCLIFCEGLSYAADLSQAGTYPVTGSNIVYSVHDYSWFHPAGQSQAAYNAKMDANSGYLMTQGRAPVWVGEFGMNTDASTAAQASGWLPQFLSWAQARPVAGACWWELSATNVLGTEPSTNQVKMTAGSREGFGLMAGQDWKGSQADVLAMLKPLAGPPPHG